MWLFDPIKIGTLSLHNRLILEPMLTNLASGKNMLLSERQAKYYTERAIGGVGLIMVGGVAINEEHRVSPNALGLFSD